ncbi:hypothetical protein M2360_003696 [Rhizobium sp. SG_E_25_P2]|nr:hypothetical protein [Rhizobium sp. SG_E_25_P2]
MMSFYTRCQWTDYSPCSHYISRMVAQNMPILHVARKIAHAEIMWLKKNASRTHVAYEKRLTRSFQNANNRLSKI